jgi:hypothetical protein
MDRVLVGVCFAAWDKSHYADTGAAVSESVLLACQQKSGDQDLCAADMQDEIDKAAPPHTPRERGVILVIVSEKPHRVRSAERF